MFTNTNLRKHVCIIKKTHFLPSSLHSLRDGVCWNGIAPHQSGCCTAARLIGTEPCLVKITYSEVRSGLQSKRSPSKQAVINPASSQIKTHSGGSFCAAATLGKRHGQMWEMCSMHTVQWYILGGNLVERGQRHPGIRNLLNWWGEHRVSNGSSSLSSFAACGS